MDLRSDWPCLRSIWILVGAAGALLATSACVPGTADGGLPGERTFTVTLTNVSGTDALVLPDGSTQAVPLSPGVWVVHTASDPMFAEGAPDFGEGLEALAEDGDPVPTVVTSYPAALRKVDGVAAAEVFDTPVGASGPAPVGPGESYQFQVVAVPGEQLSFATMFVPSNDLFFSPDGDGIALFNSGGAPVTGDVTDQVHLWDAGTEANEAPGAGPNQPAQQPEPNTGDDESFVVHRPPDDGFDYPPVAEVIQVTITVEPTALEAGLQQGVVDLATMIAGSLISDLVLGSFNQTP